MSSSTVKERPDVIARKTPAPDQTADGAAASPESIHDSTTTALNHQTRQQPAMQRANATRHRHFQSTAPLSERLEMMRIISNRLFVALFTLMAISMVGGYLTWKGHDISAGATNWLVILCGAIGGFISLQRRLKTLHTDDLLLLARSWVYVLLSPLVGGILALLLYFLFISNLLQGDLFPNFHIADAVNAATGEAMAAAAGDQSKTGLSIIFQVSGEQYQDYAKLVFWCFLAGYSESFVTNIISHFESSADKGPAATDNQHG